MLLDPTEELQHIEGIQIMGPPSVIKYLHGLTQLTQFTDPIEESTYLYGSTYSDEVASMWADIAPLKLPITIKVNDGNSGDFVQHIRIKKGELVHTYHDQTAYSVSIRQLEGCTTVELATLVEEKKRLTEFIPFTEEDEKYARQFLGKLVLEGET